jgi:[ribulose-bisphosphate carboxylase]-lysine N-methyltransferase
LGEKRALQATMEAYQTMLAAAPGLEYYQERRLRSLKLLDEGGKSTYDPFNDSFGSW